jgi:hypothetical protein
MIDPTARTADRMPKVSVWAKEGSVEAEMGKRGVISGLVALSVGRYGVREEAEEDMPTRWWWSREKVLK